MSVVRSILMFTMALVAPTCGLLAASEPSFRVCAYLPEYRVGTVTPANLQGVSDLILFSIEVSRDGSLDEQRWTARHWEATQSLRSLPGLRTHICVGGWERSGGFAEVCGSAEARQRLARELVRYCHAHDLAGVDLDWEHPSTRTEQQNFAELLGELQPVLRTEGIELSIAVAPSQKLPTTAWQSVDHIMLMSYEDTGRHSTFESMQKHMAMLLRQGVPAPRVLIGLPLFGRKIQTRQAFSYAEIVARYAPQPDQDEVDGIYFNGPGLIAAKTAWAQSVGLGGVAAWEIGQDAPGEASLLQVIRTTVREK